MKHETECGSTTGVPPRGARRVTPRAEVVRLFVVAFICCLSCSPAARAQTTPAKRPDASVRRNETLRRELLAIRQLDQGLRNELLKLPPPERERFYKEKIAPVDERHTARLREIVRRYGFPTRSLVGADGADAAFLVVQHSPSHEFQREMLPPLEDLARRGEAEPQAVALLTDRVLQGEGKPQIYGTQFDTVNGKLVTYKLVDPARVDERRKSMGLMPLADYLKLIQEMYNQPVESAPAAPPRE